VTSTVVALQRFFGRLSSPEAPVPNALDRASYLASLPKYRRQIEAAERRLDEWGI